MALWVALFSPIIDIRAVVVFETYSPYHHILVLDQGGFRTLSFDGSTETRMLLANQLRGHFEYTEYFHMPFLWNHDIKRVAMIGLGGGSTQRAYQFYYTNVVVDTIEIDPAVVSVAKKYFGVTETPRHKIKTEDGRVFLRRSATNYDLILLDAYTTGRYGSSIPPHLTTREFFGIASQRLSTNGVLAYNVIGQVQGWHSELIGALYRTMKEVFPQVYMFPANESQNVVFVATRTPEPFDAPRVRRETAALMRAGTVRLPTFSLRTQSFMAHAPPAAATAPVLTDDRAPVEGLMGND
jgi:spermidine synthase